MKRDAQWALQWAFISSSGLPQGFWRTDVGSSPSVTHRSQRRGCTPSGGGNEVAAITRRWCVSRLVGSSSRLEWETRLKYCSWDSLFYHEIHNTREFSVHILGIEVFLIKASCFYPLSCWQMCSFNPLYLFTFIYRRPMTGVDKVCVLVEDRILDPVSSTKLSRTFQNRPAVLSVKVSSQSVRRDVLTGRMT